VLTDASRTGIGFCLVQTEVGSKIPLLIMAGSRFLSPAEKNYAVVELELLAIQRAIEKCRLYLAGTDFTVITDHQPLLGILNRKNLDAINNVRIQRLMAKLLGYSFRVEWIPGKNHHMTDSLSRNPVFAAPDHKDIIIRQVTEVIMDESLAEMSDMAKADKDYQEVVTAVRSGLYDSKKIKNLRRSHPALQYRGQWDYMAVEDVFLTFHGRLGVPEAARAQVLSTLYIQHTGVTKTLMDARQLYFWPGMTNAIELMVCRVHGLPASSSFGTSNCNGGNSAIREVQY
jgi:hypothetical protein